jgi:hypothetical protein
LSAVHTSVDVDYINTNHTPTVLASSSIHSCALHLQPVSVQLDLCGEGLAPHVRKGLLKAVGTLAQLHLDGTARHDVLQGTAKSNKA